MFTHMIEEQLAPLLRHLRHELAQVLGSQIDQVRLFGSRARGEARPESDIDVLVVVRGDMDYADLMRRTSTLVAQTSLQHDVVISRVFVSKAQFENEQSPFLRNVRRESVAI